MKKLLVPCVAALVFLFASAEGCTEEDRSKPKPCKSGTVRQIEQNRFKVCEKGKWVIVENPDRKKTYA